MVVNNFSILEEIIRQKYIISILNIILHFIKIGNIENAVRQNKACIIAWRI